MPTHVIILSQISDKLSVISVSTFSWLYFVGPFFCSTSFTDMYTVNKKDFEHPVYNMSQVVSCELPTYCLVVM